MRASLRPEPDLPLIWRVMTYYDSKPYLFVSTTKECISTATVVMIPEAEKVMKFTSGYGSADLSATLSNGMIASVGQKTDTKIPETLTAIASLGTAAGGIKGMAAAPSPVICTPTATLYPVVSGKPDLKDFLSFPVSTQNTNVNKKGK